jgi:hypothetical protein
MVKSLVKEALRVWSDWNRTRLCRDSNQSLLATRNSTGKGFGASRDGVGILGGDDEFLVAETGLTGAPVGKAAGT